MSTSTIVVDRLEDNCTDSYTAFVAAHPDATFYHSFRYHSFLLDLLACQCNTLVAHCGDEIQGVMPLMSTNGSYGTVFNSLPFYGSYGGVLAANADAARALWMAYGDLLAGSDVCSGTVVVNPFRSNLDSYRDAPVGLIDHRLLQYSTLEGGAEHGGGVLVDDHLHRAVLQQRRLRDVDAQLRAAVAGAPQQPPEQPRLTAIEPFIVVSAGMGARYRG